MRRFRLDEVWWLVSPGNPLKTRGPADIERRLDACRAVAPRRRVQVTDIEARLGTRFTADTLRAMRKLYPSVRFTWLMGADNLAVFHRWDDWTWIMESFPIGVLARPGMQGKASASPAARRYRRRRVPQRLSAGLSMRRAPAWCMLTGRMSAASSTSIRARGDWP